MRVALTVALIAGAIITFAVFNANKRGTADSREETAAQASPEASTSEESAPSQSPTPEPDAQSTDSGARITFEETSLDFGSVAHGAVVTSRFKFRNDGTAPLEILSVKASCGCTAAMPSKKRFEPGESGEIEARFDTARKTVRGTSQRFVNSVMVRANAGSDDPSNQSQPGLVRLLMRGEVVSYFSIVPPSGALLRATSSGGDAAPAIVRVIPADQSEEALAGLQLDGVPDGVTVEGPTIVEVDDKKGIELKVAIADTAPVGPIREKIRVKTGNEEHPEVLVPVRGYVPPPVRAQPTRLVITHAAVSRPTVVQLISSTNEQLRVVRTRVIPDVGDPPPLVLSEPKVEDGGKRLVVSVGIESGAALAHGATGRVQFLLDSDRQPLVELPYRMYDTNRSREGYQIQQELKLRVSPMQLTLGDIQPGTMRQAIITLTDLEGGRLQVRNLKGEPEDLLKASLEPMPEDGRIARVRVAVSSTRVGVIDGKIRLQPLKGSDHTMEIPLSARVLSRISAAPQAVRIPKGEKTAEIVLSHANDLAFHVSEISGQDGLPITATALPGENGTVTVRIELVDLPQPRDVVGDITIKTDLAGEQPLIVPLFTAGAGATPAAAPEAAPELESTPGPESAPTPAAGSEGQ
jgi:hypothetical protein